MSTNWDIVLRSSMDEADLNKQVKYGRCYIDLGNGHHKELRFSINNDDTYLTTYMIRCLKVPTIFKLADDMIVTRMNYIAKIYKEYGKIRGKFDLSACLSLINEYLSDDVLAGEFEYQNFSGQNRWSEPQKLPQGTVVGHKFITTTRRDIFDDNKTPGYDWLFSNKLKSAKPCAKMESAHRARQQRITFGEEIPKPQEWNYDKWRESFLKRQGDKTPIPEHKSSSKELICSFIGMISHEKYREFRIRYTMEMMNFEVADYDALVDEVEEYIRAREIESHYKMMWATVKTGVNVNTVRYLYAMFKQGNDAVERFEKENMHEMITDWNEPGPLFKFFKFFNKTIHYETAALATSDEKITAEAGKSGIEFIEEFKEDIQLEEASVEKVFKSTSLTEDDFSLSQPPKAPENNSVYNQLCQSCAKSCEVPGTYNQKIDEVKLSCEHESSLTTAVEPALLTISTSEDVKNEVTKETNYENPERIASKSVEQKLVLSYAKVVEKSRIVEVEQPSTVPRRNSSLSNSSKISHIKMNSASSISGTSSVIDTSEDIIELKVQDASEWKQVVSKSNEFRGNLFNNKRKRGHYHNHYPISTQKKKQTTGAREISTIEHETTAEPCVFGEQQHDRRYRNIVKKLHKTDSKQMGKLENQEQSLMDDQWMASTSLSEDVASWPRQTKSMKAEKQYSQRKSKTATRKAKKAAKAALIEKKNTVSTFAEPQIEMLIMNADDNTFTVTEFNVTVKKNKSKSKKKKKHQKEIEEKKENIDKEMMVVEAHFSDDLATVFVNNASFDTQNNFQKLEEDSSFTIEHARLASEPEVNDSDEYFPRQAVTFSPNNENGSESSATSFSNLTDTLSSSGKNKRETSKRYKKLKKKKKSGSPCSQELIIEPETTNMNFKLKMQSLADFAPRASDPILHDLFRRLKFVADKQNRGGLRNCDFNRRSLIQKRLGRFLNAYTFRLRVAKAMLYIMDTDAAADISGMKEHHVVRNLIAYLVEPVDSDPDTLRGRSFDMVAEKTSFDEFGESDFINRGLRYIDLRVSELDVSEPLHAQYTAISDRVYNIMKEQEVLLKIIGNTVDFRGYDKYL